MRVLAGKIAAILVSSLLPGAAPAVAMRAEPAAAQAVPAPRWSSAALARLYAEAKAAEREGLDPSSYDLAGLATLAAAGNTAATDRAADAIALALGRVHAFRA